MIDVWAEIRTVMKVDVNWGERNANGTFLVKAKDVASAVRFLQARGEWGRFEGHIPYKWKGDARGMVTSVMLAPSFKITMPTWPAYRNQQQEIKDDWDAMYSALRKHEDGHREIFDGGVRKLVKDLEALGVVKGGGVKSTVRKAAGVIQKKHDSYDTRTEHGRLTGVVLRVPQPE